MCGAPTSLVALGVIEIVALTHVLTAGPELAPVPSVFRVSETPPTVTVVWAETVEVPVVGEVIVVVHDPAGRGALGRRVRRRRGAARIDGGERDDGPVRRADEAAARTVMTLTWR